MRGDSKVLESDVAPGAPGEIKRLLTAAGGATTATDLGVPLDLYREAIIHCREMRNRFSFLDIAADAGTLEVFAAGEH